MRPMRTDVGLAKFRLQARTDEPLRLGRLGGTPDASLYEHEGTGCERWRFSLNDVSS
jgi:hypothetical protein